MPELTPEQKKRKLEKIARVMEDGEVGILEYLMEIEDKLENEIPDLKEVIKRMKGEDGAPGSDYVITDEDKVEIIQSLKELFNDNEIASKVFSLIDVEEIAQKASKYVKVEKPADGKTPTVKEITKIVKPLLPSTRDIALEASKLTVEAIKPLIPSIDSLEEKLPTFGEYYRDGLELLKGDNRLDSSAIKGIKVYDEDIATLQNRTQLLNQLIGGLDSRIGTGGGGGVTDHGALTGLADDDHTQYALLAGRSGGQTIIGGTGTTDDLILRTTSGAGTTGADIIFQGGNNGATEFGRFLNSGDFSVGSNAIYVNAASKYLGINTATHESYHLRIVTSSTQGLKMTRVAPFAGSEFRVDLSGSGAEIVATGSGGTSVIRGFVSGATQAYFSAGHLAVGATAGSARIHSTWTGGAQLRAEYNSTNYWTLTQGSGGGATYNIQGTTPVHRFDVNSVQALRVAAGYVTVSGTSPWIELDDAGGYGLKVSAGNANPAAAGIYEAGTSSAIAEYDYASGNYNYAGGNLYYDVTGGILYSNAPFNTPDVQTVSLTATGNTAYNGNVQMTGLTTGVGPPATILTGFNLYVDTVTGILYVD